MTVENNYNESVEERAFTHVEKPSEKKYTIEDMEECFEQARSVQAPFTGRFPFKFKDFNQYIDIYK